MSASPLGEEEVGLLRCINNACRVPGRACAVRIDTLRKAANDPAIDPAVKEILAWMDLKAFAALVGSLREYHYIDASPESGGGSVWITPEGRAHIYKIDHPDLVEKIIQWARHHPVWSRVIIVCMVLGPVVALCALGISVASLFIAMSK